MHFYKVAVWFMYAQQEAGKSLIAGEIARLATEKGIRSTLFLIHRRELVKQLREYAQ